MICKMPKCVSSRDTCSNCLFAFSSGSGLSAGTWKTNKSVGCYLWFDVLTVYMSNKLKYYQCKVNIGKLNIGKLKSLKVWNLENLKTDEWWMMNDEWWMMNGEWWIMNEEWRMMNDEWWTKVKWIVFFNNSPNVILLFMIFLICPSSTYWGVYLALPTNVL